MRRRNFMLSVSAAALGGGLAKQPPAAGAADATTPAAADAVDVEAYRDAATKRWEAAIAALEAKDKSEQHPADGVLFVGSSSIRRWDDIAADMAPYHPIQRGYGGAKWSDVAVFAPRLITPHAFRAAVFFVGNDIVGKETDKSPSEVVGLFAYVLKVLRRHHATAPVFFIAVTPTESRLSAWPQVKAANAAVRHFCQQTAATHFIGTQSIFLDAAGQPRADLFVEDRLHLNRAGYIRWSAAIKSHLDSVLG